MQLGRTYAARVTEALQLQRRGGVRYEIHSATAYAAVVSGEDAPCPVRVEDLSAGGMALLAGRRIAPNALLSVDLLSKDDVGCGGWSCGCARPWRCLLTRGGSAASSVCP